MKYVRTKDCQVHKVLKEEKDFVCIHLNPSDDDPCYADPAYPKSEIVKESDAIDELGDVVVVKYSYESLPKTVETMRKSSSRPPKRLTRPKRGNTPK